VCASSLTKQGEGSTKVREGRDFHLPRSAQIWYQAPRCALRNGIAPRHWVRSKFL